MMGRKQEARVELEGGPYDGERGMIFLPLPKKIWLIREGKGIKATDREKEGERGGGERYDLVRPDDPAIYRWHGLSLDPGDDRLVARTPEPVPA